MEYKLRKYRVELGVTEKELSNIVPNDDEQWIDDKQRIAILEKKINVMRAEIDHLKFVFCQMIMGKPIPTKAGDCIESTLRLSISNDASFKSNRINSVENNAIDSKSDRPPSASKLATK
ncbi:uncharacterized protein LOC126899177 [Daktulosphaira vitifoliae]|uniref:uncharacterized protein LOC126899177 n=1 Tax=Daktulosphaira vitifoliae TaxID=58002 RepID=UPI0021A98F75|nr:uncharacterized protein LOC126899177 [Daktulosphaira vitifoliae]